MKKGFFAILFSAALVAAFALTGCNSGEPYAPQAKTPEVSSPAVVTSGTLRVGVNTGNPPLAGQSSSIMGIDVDIAAALADDLGLKLEIVDVKSDAAAALKAGTIDVALGVDSSTTEKGTDLWLSDVYLQTAVALFSTSQTAPLPTTADANNVKIGAQISSLSAWTVTNEFGSSILKNETDLPTAFKELASGGVNYVAADAIVGAYAARSNNVNAYAVGLTQAPAGYSAAVSASNTTLQNAISSKLNQLGSTGVISLIEKKWLGTSLDLAALPTTAGAQKNTVNANAPAEETQVSENAASTGEIATNAVV